MFTIASTTSHQRLRRIRLPAWIAAFLATVGFASSSCASPRLPVGGGYSLRSRAQGYELQVLVDGAPVSTYEHGLESYVLGQLGARYTLRIVNPTSRRIEVVVSVDGRDAIDGKSADVRKRGYLIPAWGSIDIDGWRLSRAEVAAFRFSRVADSYAARSGAARDVGVIGVAVFPERYLPRPRPLYTPPSPPNDWLSPSRRGHQDSRDDAGAAASAPAPSASGAEPLAERESAAAKRSRPGLGTEFGEAVSSPVREVGFVRADATRPSAILGARYNDRDGLLALGIDVDGCCTSGDDLAQRQTATPFPVSDRGYAAPPRGWQQGCCLRY